LTDKIKHYLEHKSFYHHPFFGSVFISAITPYCYWSITSSVIVLLQQCQFYQWQMDWNLATLSAQNLSPSLSRDDYATLSRSNVVTIVQQSQHAYPHTQVRKTTPQLVWLPYPNFPSCKTLWPHVGLVSMEWRTYN